MKLINAVKSMWTWLKAKFTSLIEQPIVKKAAHIVVVAVSKIPSVVVPTIVGIWIVYSWPFLGCAIAAIPIAKVISNRFNLGAVGNTIGMVLAMATLDMLFVSIPYVVYMLAIYACIVDWKAWMTKLQEAYKEGLSAIKMESQNATT